VVSGADYSHAYIDVKDAQWSCKSDLVPVDINQISSSQFVIYRFGVFVIKLLHQQIGNYCFLSCHLKVRSEGYKTEIRNKSQISSI
jgi:hypothetical protein